MLPSNIDVCGATRCQVSICSLRIAKTAGQVDSALAPASTDA
jgi:hypothetical protein